MASEAEGENLLLFACILGGVYVLWTVWRDQEASEAQPYAVPGPSGAPPAPDATKPLLSFPAIIAPAGVTADLLNAIVPQTLSPAGEAFIKLQEGWTPVPVPDAGGYEIGWGHKILEGEHFPKPITQAGVGQSLFEQDAGDAIALVRNVKVALTQNQFDALVDLAFNIPAALSPKSSVMIALQAGNYAGAAANFALYNKSQGRINSTLVKRRKAEANRFTMTGGTS